jgi:hypothetical protein
VCQQPRAGSCGLLGAAGERRQDFNLYGPAELAFEIFLMSRLSIDQY